MRRLLVLTACCAATVTAWAQLDDSVWPMAGANYSTDRAVVEPGLPGPAGRTIWTTTADMYGNPLNPGGGAPSEGGAVIDSDGYIYYKSNGGTATYIYKLDPITGAVVAQAHLGAGNWANRSAPVVGVDYVYTANWATSDIKVLYKSDLSTYMTIADPAMPLQKGFRFIALGSVPNINGNLNIYGYARDMNAIYAFDAVTGALMWIAPISPYNSGFCFMGPFWISEGKQVLSVLLGNGTANPGGIPIAIRDNGDTTYTQLYSGALISVTFGTLGALSEDGSRIYYLVRPYSDYGAPRRPVWAISTTDGSVVWSVPPEELPISGQNQASPAVLGNRVYVCGLDGWVAAIDDLGTTYSIAWVLQALHRDSFVNISAVKDSVTGEVYVYASQYGSSRRLYAIRDHGTYGETVAIKEYASPLSWSGLTNIVMADGNVIQLASDRVIKYAPGVPPVADAGEDTVFQATSCAAGLAVLDGSGSYDPDGTIVRYLWREGLTTIADVTTPITHVKLPAGTHYLTLTVFDNEDFVSSDDVEITIVAQRLPPPVELRLDEQVNHDPSLGVAFDAITATGPSVLTFESEGIDGNARVFVAPNGAFEGPHINFNLACYDPIDLSAPGAILHFSTRYFRDSGYTDAAISARLRDVNGAAADFGVLYGPEPDPRFPAWQTVTTEMTFESTDPGFDLTQIAAVEFYGTNWGGTGRDFVDVKNLYLGAGADFKADGSKGTVEPFDIDRVVATCVAAPDALVRGPGLTNPMVTLDRQHRRQSAADVPITTAALRDVQAATAVRQTSSPQVSYNTSALAASADPTAAAEAAGAAEIRVGGDTCEEARIISQLPYTDSGDTCGYTDDYFEACPNTEPRGPDVVYFFVPPTDLIVDISLCNSGYDTKVYVYADDCPDPGNPVACNDDAPGCGPDGYRSRINGLVLSAGITYYIVVDGWSDKCGQYELTIAERPPCVIDPYLDALDEAEPGCGIGSGGDTTDGGCNSMPAVFIPLEIGDAVWGTVGTDDANRLRDTDWYVTELTAAQTVTWRVVADFDVRAFILRENGPAGGSCDYEIVERATGGPCAQVDVTAVLVPGVYYFWVGPNRYTGVPCGKTYQAELISRMGACCFIAGGCGEFMSAADCLAAEGFYRGDGSTCEEAWCCEIECPAGAVLEGEPCGEDTNGGCNSDGEPANWEPIIGNTVICGTAWSNEELRETDWYELNLDEETQLTVSFTAQFPVTVGVLWHVLDDPGGYDYRCDFDMVTLVWHSADTCNVGEFTTCLPAGLYTLFVAPSYWFSLPCPAQYIVDVSFDQPCPTGACCFPFPASTCVDGWTESTCATEGGVFAGADTTCADDPCFACQPGDTLEGEPPCHDGYIDTYNGGCNSQPPVFQPIACGETICGAGGTFDDGWTRDTDWYQVQILEPTILTWHIEEAEFNLMGYVIDGTYGCGAYGIIAGVYVPAGGSGSVGVAVEPGVYWLWIGATGFFEVIPCGVGFRATLSCEPFAEPVCPEPSVFGQSGAQPDEPWTFYVSDKHPGAVIDYGEVLFTFRHRVYDNFTGVVEPVGRLRWWGINAFADWGGWYYLGPKDPDDFDVTFYADEGGLPGTILAQYGPLTPEKVATYTYYGGIPLFEYTAVLDPPYEGLSSGWVSAQGVFRGQDSVFLWLNSPMGDGHSLIQGPTGHFQALATDFAVCLATPTLLGDLNCDGAVNFGDINPFVQYLLDFTGWQAAFPGCPPEVGDINGDGEYPSFADVNPFVALLSGQ